MLKQAESLPQSSEELLRYCDLELHRLRAQRAGGRKHRGAVLAAALFVLILGTLGAFFVLFSRLQELPHHSPAPASGLAPQ
jgi:hypothetical protein